MSLVDKYVYPTDFQVRDIFDFVTRTIEKAITMCSDTQTGGYFCLADAETGIPILVKRIGAPEPADAKEYFQYACEKAARLAAHPDHLSSWQSRDKENGKYGGAIRTNIGAGFEFIFSFSGLPEKMDETAMIVTARLSKMLTAPQGAEIQNISGNYMVEALMDKVRLE